MSIISEKIKMGEAYGLDIDDRYFLQTAESAMNGNIVRGLVELITNCDDSYYRLEKKGIEVNGKIEISIERKRNNKNSIIKVLDYAEGMSLKEMLVKLKRVGSITSGFSETRSRGLMGRGSKECVIFGQLRFQSVKDGIYSEIKITKKPLKFIPICEEQATQFRRIEAGIEKNNGTLVTLEVEPQYKIPLYKSLVEMLSKYYSLRDIVTDSNSNRGLILIDSKNLNRKEIPPYSYPKGEIVFDDKINISGYPEAEAHLIIRKSPQRINCESGSPYWEGGILVKSSHAIHEVSSLSKKIEKNPYFEFYFGKIVCPYIDDLIIEFEEIEEKEGEHSGKNPCRIIDPLRKGLAKDHPFVKYLYDKIAQQMSLLLKSDEDKAGQKIREIENKKTKDRFKKLANEASKFIKDNTEDIDIEDENYLTPAEIETGGMIIIPTGLKMVIGEEKKAYIYTRPSVEQREKHIITTNDSDCIKLDSEIIGLTDWGDRVYVGILSVRGIKEGSAKIKLSWGNISKYLSVSVMVEREVWHDIKEFQFEKDNYTVKEGKKKNIKVFAHWPEFVRGRVKLKISMDDTSYCKLLTENIILDYDRKSEEIFGRKLATGIVKILGLKTGGPVAIITGLRGEEIIARVRVAPKKEFGKNFEIKIVDEDLGDQRSVLLENIMKINGRHKNIKRYLGPPEDFLGQDSIHFRLLIAELIADTVSRRILELNAQKNVSEYKDMDVTSFYRKHREYMNNFLEIAHRIQIPDSEINKNYRGSVDISDKN